MTFTSDVRIRGEKKTASDFSDSNCGVKVRVARKANGVRRAAFLRVERHARSEEECVSGSSRREAYGNSRNPSSQARAEKHLGRAAVNLRRTCRCRTVRFIFLRRMLELCWLDKPSVPFCCLNLLFFRDPKSLNATPPRAFNLRCMYETRYRPSGCSDVSRCDFSKWSELKLLRSARIPPLTSHRTFPTVLTP